MLPYTIQHRQNDNEFDFGLNAELCGLLVFLLMVSVFSTTLSLSALSVLCNHTQNESSATLSALFLTRLRAPVLHQPKHRLNLISATVVLWVCTRCPAFCLQWITPQVKTNKWDSLSFLNRYINTAVAAWKAFIHVTPKKTKLTR